eukprot:CAMPEP_0204483910 /NCGR_PEP_ID=MMETSP0471-20130131/55944_1 /ASSEMBLY_ACC=CAM_ASM_000602 /TAXON_ID=2969 /ORGANISM="Oxyrrhis marina" /LENGTH=44 /DNA_ID= /DNA_START= /DNA_END= /DNA_ORIENTATION=
MGQARCHQSVNPIELLEHVLRYLPELLCLLDLLENGPVDCPLHK